MVFSLKGDEFPGGLVVKIMGFHCHGTGSIPGWESKVQQAVQRGQNKTTHKKQKNTLVLESQYL